MENSTKKTTPTSFRLSKKHLLVLDYAASSWKCDRTKALCRIIDGFYASQLSKGMSPVSSGKNGGNS